MDPILDDAERLERALTAWRAGRNPLAAFDELPASLRMAARAAVKLDLAGADRIAGARPSFVRALEDQLRADLRLGLGGPGASAQPVAAPRLKRRLWAAVLLALWGGYALRGVAGLKRATPMGNSVPLVENRAPAVGMAPAADPAMGGSPGFPHRLPWLPARSPLPPVLVAADGDDAVPGGVAAAAPSSIRAVRPAPVRSISVRQAASVPVATLTPAPAPVLSAPVPSDPVPSDPAQSDPPSAEPGAADEPAEPGKVPTVTGGGGQASGAPPQEVPPLRTPDAEPEP